MASPPRLKPWTTRATPSNTGAARPIEAYVGITAIISLRRQLFARWFALASVALTLLSIAGAFTIGYATTATYVLSGAAIVLDSVWIFLVSLFLWRDPTLALPSTRLGDKRQGSESEPSTSSMG